jgi:hypothetical protein
MRQAGKIQYFIGLTLLLLSMAFLYDCTDPEEVCNKAVEVATLAVSRCDSTSNYHQTKENLLQMWALGDCKTIKKIRDINALIDDCWPWLEKVSCDLLLSGKTHPACQNQLLIQDTEEL